MSLYEDEAFIKTEMENFNGFLRLFSGEDPETIEIEKNSVLSN